MLCFFKENLKINKRNRKMSGCKNAFSNNNKKNRTKKIIIRKTCPIGNYIKHIHIYIFEIKNTICFGFSSNKSLINMFFIFLYIFFNYFSFNLIWHRIKKQNIYTRNNK